jgi:hypothetical protein
MTAGMAGYIFKNRLRPRPAFPESAPIASRIP